MLNFIDLAGTGVSKMVYRLAYYQFGLKTIIFSLKLNYLKTVLDYTDQEPTVSRVYSIN